VQYLSAKALLKGTFQRSCNQVTEQHLHKEKKPKETKTRPNLPSRPQCFLAHFCMCTNLPSQMYKCVVWANRHLYGQTLPQQTRSCGHKIRQRGEAGLGEGWPLSLGTKPLPLLPDTKRPG